MKTVKNIKLYIQAIRDVENRISCYEETEKMHYQTQKR